MASITITTKKQHAARAALTVAVVKVGDGGRGFIVETKKRERIVITAAHRLPKLPPAHPGSYTEERTYPRLLGPLGKSKPAVWAECLFADPLADTAVLGSPDNQLLAELIGVVMPLLVVDAPKQGTKPVQSSFSNKALEVPTPGQCAALVLSLDGEWVKCSVKRRGAWLSIDEADFINGGMSGSPIVSMTGHAIGLVSVNPAIPPRIGLLKHRTDAKVSGETNVRR